MKQSTRQLFKYVLEYYAVLSTIMWLYTEGFTMMTLKVSIFLLVMMSFMSLWKSQRNIASMAQNYSIFMTVAIFKTYDLYTSFVCMFLPVAAASAFFGAIYYYRKK